MSDENEHENEHNHPAHIHAFGLNFGPSPEEIEQAKMAMLASGHETRQFLDGLDKEQLNKLALIMQVIHQTDGEAAIYYSGLIRGILDFKWKVCIACGLDHEAELHSMGESDSPNHPIGGVPKKGTLAYDSLMTLYDVEPDDDGSDHVMCKNCQKWYENLEDRMRRKPGVEGCEGCIQKEKWG